MKSAVFIFAVIMCWHLSVALHVSAVPPGKVMTWEAAGGAGKVVVDGSVHAGKGIKCMECHTRIFPMKKGGVRFTMSDMYTGRYCGECHNGSRAFSAQATANCARCHGK